MALKDKKIKNVVLTIYYEGDGIKAGERQTINFGRNMEITEFNFKVERGIVRKSHDGKVVELQPSLFETATIVLQGATIVIKGKRRK